MARKEDTPRARAQARLAKVVWGLFFIALGVLFTLQNMGRIKLAESPFAPDKAVDGDPHTRWSSSFSQPQWISVDLGEASEIKRIKLNWEAAYAKEYDLEVSDDGESWSTVQHVTDGHGSTEEFPVSTRGRYVRMVGTKRATPYGLSLWELEVYGPDGLLSQGKKTAASSLEPGNYWGLLWPLALIAAGLPAIVLPKDAGNQVMGVLLVGIGGFFELQHLGLISVEFGTVWPAFLIVAGGMLLLQSIRGGGAAPTNVGGQENPGSPQ
jgi:hypothetical protein